MAGELDRKRIQEFARKLFGHYPSVSLAEGGTGLGTAWGEEKAREMLADAGFTAIEVLDAPGPQNSIYICHRGG